MTDTITIDGSDYDLTGNPSLGTVREVQSMQMGILLEHIDEKRLREMDNLESEEEIVQGILDSGGYEAFNEVMWERSNLENLQTLSLAVDEKLDSSDLDAVPAKDYMDYIQKAEDCLDGSASDFFEELGIGIQLQEDEMKQLAEDQTGT